MAYYGNNGIKAPWEYNLTPKQKESHRQRIDAVMKANPGMKRLQAVKQLNKTKGTPEYARFQKKDRIRSKFKKAVEIGKKLNEGEWKKGPRYNGGNLLIHSTGHSSFEIAYPSSKGREIGLRTYNSAPNNGGFGHHSGGDARIGSDHPSYKRYANRVFGNRSSGHGSSGHSGG